jgi:formamidopyrimidine-DNA glycosylase
MPEAPEVEAVARALRPLVEGRTIRSARVLHSAGVRPQTSATIARNVRGQRIENVSRRGKYLLLDLASGVLVAHFKFDGQLLFFDDAPPRGTHVDVLLKLDRGTLGFVDQRHLGTMTWHLNADAVPALRKLGVDVMSREFTSAAFAKRIGESKKPIKPLLMEQSRIAGIGNIYSSEILWHAQIDPRRRGDRLAVDDWRRLHNAVVKVIQRAVECCSNPPPNFRDTEWWFTGLDKLLRVYQREGEPCRRCGNAIRRIQQDGRSSYFCVHCQT